jgi:hypothetical protein
MRETSQPNVFAPFPRLQTVPERKLVRDFRALIVFVRAVKRSQERERVDDAETKRERERERE